jgi:uncharacterized membrane protein YhaH (DUF805 family)
MFVCVSRNKRYGFIIATIIVILINYILQIKDKFRATDDYTDEIFVKVIIAFLIALRLFLETVNHV